MRLLLPLSALLAIASAFLLYGIKHDTRSLEIRVQAGERAIARAESDIAMLRAERAHLSRPERIGPLARALGFAPPSAEQLVRADVPEGKGRRTGALPDASRRHP
jgi:cell division protein FtsL